MRLLIIDDNQDDRVLVKRLLPADSDVRESGNLAQAFDALKDSAWKPDVILLDVHLPDGPGPNGESFLAVKELSTHAPVIVVSASSLSDDPTLGRQSREAGAAGFTSKELILFSPENLARQIDWAMCPAARSLEEAVNHPNDSPEFSAYNPNSLPALLARIITQQEAMHQENQTASIVRKQQLDRIEEQVNKTNGRVTSLEGRASDLEKVNSDRDTMKNTALKVGSVLLTVFLFLFGTTLKERAFIDNDSIRKIVVEEMGKQRPPVAAPGPPVP